jgi:signal peptidase I
MRWRRFFKDRPRVRKRKEISPLRRGVGLVVCVLVFSVLIALEAGRFRVFRVTSESMLPTIAVGDFLLVNARTPPRLRRGGIVAVHNPRDHDEWLCKRLVGMPNDRIELPLDGYLYINGERQDREPYVSTDLMETEFPVSWTLGENEYMVLGDNRPASYDSRDFGPVRTENFIGVVVARYWPISRMRSFRGEKATR